MFTMVGEQDELGLCLCTSSPCFCWRAASKLLSLVQVPNIPDASNAVGTEPPPETSVTLGELQNPNEN
jgi:hypothetical protein